jgi:hypothetical protein
MQEDQEDGASKGGSSSRDSSVQFAIAERTDAGMCDISSLAYSETQSLSDMVPYSPPGVGVRDVVRCARSSTCMLAACSLCVLIIFIMFKFV